MSDLNSFSQFSSIQTHKSLSQLVESSAHLLKGSDTQKYMNLGNLYLTTLVTQVVYFQIKAQPKSIKKFLSSNFIQNIANRILSGLNSKQLLVGMGMLCLSKSSKAVQSVISQLTDIISQQMVDLACEDNEKSFFDMNMNKQLDALHLSTDAESQIMSQNSFTKIGYDAELNMISKITFNLSFSEVQGHEEHLVSQVNQYIGESKDYASMFNQLVNFKPNTFKILEDTNIQVGSLFTSNLKISFVDFLNENQLKYYSASEQGTNKKNARSKSSKNILRQFFNAFPYVFKDFKHCISFKNSKF